MMGGSWSGIETAIKFSSAVTASASMRHHPSHLAVLFLALDRFPLVVLLLPLADAQLQLGPAILEIARQRPELRPLHLRLVFELARLALVNQQLSRAQRVVVIQAGFFVRIDVAAVQKQLAALNARERLLQVRVAPADRLDFAAE